MDLVNVAHKIKELRLQQQLTIDQLAARSGLSKGYISRLENFRTGAESGRGGARSRNDRPFPQRERQPGICVRPP